MVDFTAECQEKDKEEEGHQARDRNVDTMMAWMVFQTPLGCT